MPLYLEILFQVGVPSLALVKVMWFEDLTHIPLLYIQKQNSKMEEENFFIIKLCREHGEVTRISLQAHAQEKCIPGLKNTETQTCPCFMRPKFSMLFWR